MPTREQILQDAYDRGFEKAAQALGDAGAYGVDAKPALERAKFTNPGPIRRFFGAQPRLKSFELQPRYGKPYTTEELEAFQRMHPRADIRSTTAAPIASEYGSQESFVKAVDDANAYRASRPGLFGAADGRYLASRLTPDLLGKHNIHLFPRDNGFISNRPVRSAIGWTPSIPSPFNAVNQSTPYGLFSGKDSATYNLYRSGLKSPTTVGHESRHSLQPYPGFFSNPYSDTAGNEIAWRNAPTEHAAELGRYVAGLREAGVPLTRDNLAKFINLDSQRYMTDATILDDTTPRVDSNVIHYPAYSGKEVFTPDASMPPSDLYADSQYGHDRARKAYAYNRDEFDYRRRMHNDNMEDYKRDLARYERRPKLLRRFYEKPEGPVFNISAPGPAPTIKPLRDSIGRVYDAPYGAPAANGELFPRGERSSDAEQRIERLIQRAPGFVQTPTRDTRLKTAYARGFEKAAQEAAPLFSTNDIAQLKDREGFGKRRAPGMLYYDKDPTTEEYTVPTLPFGLQIPTNDASRRAAVSNSLVRAGTPAASVTGIFEGRTPVNRAHMRSAVVDSLNNEFAPRAERLVPNWGSLPRDIQQRVARDVMYPGAWSPKAIGHLGTNGFAQAADEFERNGFPPKTKQYVSELAARLRTHAANTARPAPVVSPQAQAALIEQIQRLRASRNKR